MSEAAAQKSGPTGLSRYVSVLQGIRPFDKSRLSSDVVAGVTLAALAIPEVMGYTKIAGTPVITGPLHDPAARGRLRGPRLLAPPRRRRRLGDGGDHLRRASPASSISGLQPDTNEWLAYASLAALITGGLLILARIARLGFLADFISRTVLVGFLTGVGIQVALGPVRGHARRRLARRRPRPPQRHGDQVLGHAEGDPGHLARHARGLAGA